jgi:general secretion pathway protein E
MAPRDNADPLAPQDELSPEAMAALARAARAAGQAFAAAVAERLHVDAYEALRLGAATLGMRYLAPETLHRLTADFAPLGFAEAERRGIAVLRTDDGRLVVAVDDPFDVGRIDWIENRCAEPFELALAVADEIRAVLKRYETSVRAVDGVLIDVVAAGRGDGTAAPNELSIGRIAEDGSAVVRLVNSMLYDALKAEASDVHLTGDAAGMSLQYRIDGVLDAAGRIDDTGMGEQVISRIKVLADLDIAERRVPQDGRFQVRIDGRDIDLRVSIMPAVHGEDAVVRILDKKRLADEARGLRFEALGFDAATIAGLRALSRRPFGLLLVTGPTGSGKTTTLYTALSEARTGRDKIITIEDPVEYQLPGVVQIPVNEKRGLSFSRGLRSILRHDPDTIMVGEIRDGETGQIAVQAALTGHLVFTTVHANSVFDVLGRMLHIGVDPFNLTAALNAVVAQRLVRVNCTHCAMADGEAISVLAAAERDALAGAVPQRGRGCGHCRGTGYRGRRAIAEILVLDDALRDLIGARSSLAAVKEAARARGVRSIRRAGLDQVALGATSIEELNRVTVADADALA